jgi:hypothetical protein
MTLDQHEVGPKTQTRRVGYYPDDHVNFPGAKDSWVILCTVKGARGPFVEFRIVNYGPWEMAPHA